MKAATPFVGLTAALLISCQCHAQEPPPKPPELKVLQRFAGTWDEEVTIKATGQNPKETKTTGITTNEWVLGGRFLQVKNRRQPEGREFLQLWTYDPQKNTYRGWHFTSLGQAYQWTDQWDEESKTMSGKGVIGNSVRKGRFIDKDTVAWTLVAKDRDGKVILDLKAKQTRRKAPVETPKEKELDAKTPELEILDRLTGSWATTAVSKPAVWTPKEVRTKSRVDRKWVLQGRFLEDRSKALEGTQGSSLALMTYDSQRKAYRGWWFSSEGHTAQWAGQWDDRAETMSFTSDQGNGLTSRSSVRFIDKDRHEWKVDVRDGDGKLYFDTTWAVTRRKQ